jgi:D-alanyl-lipoteichoic acid acyltransferase DltB (MBOAT superfamily)
MLACAAVVWSARGFPRLRDVINIVAGSAWLLAVCGWQYTGGLLLVALLIFYTAGRMSSHLAMLLSAALLLAGACYLFGTQPLGVGGRIFVGLTAGRLIYYAFELSAIRPSKRSLLTFLSYAPLGLLLWPGPTMLSYMTFTTVRPREELDRLAGKQLLTAGAKLLAFALLLRAIRSGIPDVGRFPELPFTTQVLIILSVPAMFFFSLSVRQDFAASMCNFAGYYAPSSFHAPFLAENPFEMWRRWNVHIVDFLRRAFIYPAVRWRRSAVVAAFTGLGGSGLYHLFEHNFLAGPEMDWLPSIARIGFHAVVNIAVLLLVIPIDLRRKDLSWPARVLLTAVTQLGACVLVFCIVPLEIFYGTPLPQAPLCLLMQMFYRGAYCPW